MLKNQILNNNPGNQGKKMHAIIITNIIFIIASRIFESFLTFFSFPKRIKLTPNKDNKYYYNI